MHGKIYGIHYATKTKENKLHDILTSYSTNSTFVLCRKFVLSVEAMLVFAIVGQPYEVLPVIKIFEGQSFFFIFITHFVVNPVSFCIWLFV